MSTKMTGDNISFLFDDATNDPVGFRTADQVELFFFKSATEQASTDLVTATVAEINRLDVTALGVGEANKAVALDASGNFIMPDNGMFGLSRAVVAAAGTDATNATVLADQVNAVTAADGTKGVALPAAATTTGPIYVINTVLTSGGDLKVYPVNGGNDNINGGAEDAAFTMGPGKAAWFTPTSATQWYVEDVAGVTATTAELNYNDIATLGTGAASKAVVLDAGEDYVWPSGGVLKTGVLKDVADTTLAATHAEINRTCDVSTRIVNVTTTPLAVTEADHSGKTLVLDKADGLAITLPAAAAGLKFRFIIKTTITSASTIKSATGADIMIGYALMGNDSDNTVVRWPSVAADTADTIDLLGTSNSTGGMAGQEIEIEGLATNLWFVKIVGDAAGTEATPFTNTVA